MLVSNQTYKIYKELHSQGCGDIGFKFMKNNILIHKKIIAPKKI